MVFVVKSFELNFYTYFFILLLAIISSCLLTFFLVKDSFDEKPEKTTKNFKSLCEEEWKTELAACEEIMGDSLNYQEEIFADLEDCKDDHINLMDLCTKNTLKLREKLYSCENTNYSDD